MMLQMIHRDQWPDGIAHATERAISVWRCTRNKPRRIFYIFRQPKESAFDGAYLVREETSHGWMLVDGDFQTLGAAKKAAEIES